ncbi:MAG: hypothetical protein QM831_40410 [Kofleriaceae bacterium]
MQRIFWVLAITGCATTHYQHSVTAPLVDDANVHAELAVQGDVIRMSLVNKTDDVLEIQWNKIELDRGDGTTTILHPAADLGWVNPNSEVIADLVPLAFADAMMPATTYTLSVPAIVRREPHTYRFALAVQTKAIAK